MYPPVVRKGIKDEPINPLEPEIKILFIFGFLNFRCVLLSILVILCLYLNILDKLLSTIGERILPIGPNGRLYFILSSKGTFVNTI